MFTFKIQNSFYTATPFLSNSQHPEFPACKTCRNITAMRSALVFAHIYHRFYKHQQIKSNKNISVAFVNLLCFSFKLLYIYLFKNNLCPSCTCAQTLLYITIPLHFTRLIKYASSCVVLIVFFKFSTKSVL